MNIDEIRAIAERLVQLRKMSLGPYDIDVDPVRDYGAPAAVSSALLAALPEVEALKAYEHECDNPVPDYMHRRHLREHLFKTIAAFDKTIEGMKL